MASNVFFRVTNGELFVVSEGNKDAVKVIESDSLYNNGVIHTIDTALLPEELANLIATLTSTQPAINSTAPNTSVEPTATETEPILSDTSYMSIILAPIMILLSLKPFN